MDKEELLKKRKELKNKKPDFTRTDSHKKDRIGNSWRNPRGLQNKMRLNKRGYNKCVRTGWGSPKAVKGLHPTGLEPIRVHNTNDLEDIDEELQGIIIASNVGDRKRVKIIEEAQERDISILNLDGDEYLEKVEQKIEKRQEKRKKREEKRKEREKQAEETSDDEEKIDPEEQKKKEKEQMQKVVEKGEQ